MARKVKKPTKIWDNYVEVGEVMKTAKVKYIFAAAIRDGVRFINIREFYYRVRIGEWLPTKDGITIPMKWPIKLPDGHFEFQEVFEPFVKQLIEALDLLAALPLHDPANERWYYPEPEPEEPDENIRLVATKATITSSTKEELQ